MGCVAGDHDDGIRHGGARRFFGNGMDHHDAAFFAVLRKGFRSQALAVTA